MVKTTPFKLELNRIQATEFSEGAVMIDGILYESLEEVPEEIRPEVIQALAGKHVTKKGGIYYLNKK